MKQDGKVLVNVGMDRLYHEIFASALSLHGWQVKWGKTTPTPT